MSIRIDDDELRLRKMIAEMKRKNEDPEFIRYYLRNKQGFTDEAIERELDYGSGVGGEDTGGGVSTVGMTETAKAIAEGKLDYQSFKKGSTTTEVGVVREQLLKAGFDISGKEEETGVSPLTEQGTRLKEKIANLGSAAEREGAVGAIAAIKGSKDIERLITEGGVSTGPIEGNIQKALARLKDKKPEELTQKEKNFIDFNAATTAFTANFIKAISGAQVSDKERQFLMNALPAPNKQEAENVQGMQQLVSFLKNKYEFALGEEFETDLLYKDKDVAETPETPAPPSRKEQDFKQAELWLEANPDHPQAEKVRGILSKQIAEPTTDIGSEKPTLESVEPATIVEKKKKPLPKKIGDFLGISKFGEGIGAAMFLKTKEGKKLIKDAEKGDKLAVEALNEILGDAPNAKELIGSAALTALNIATVGTASKLKGASAAVKIGAGTVTGGAFGLAGGLEQDKDTKGIVKSTAIGAAVGGVVSAAGVGWQKWREAKRAARPQHIRDAVGKMIQGKTKDKEAALNTLRNVDTSGVKTYKQLGERVDDNLAALGDSMDEILKKDDKARKLTQLGSKIGNKKINYVDDALGQLDDLYSKTNDYENADRVKTLILKAKKEGLSLLEINDIAKEHGRVRNAFTKAGELSTGVNKQSYENVRKGVKSVVRRFLPTDDAKKIDRAFYETLNTQKLVESMTEKVNQLEQKIVKRGFFGKIGRSAGKAISKIPIVGSGAEGFLQAFVPSNAGNKTMNSIALQEVLKKNLKVIENNGTKITQKIADRVSTGGPITNAFIQNLLRELRDED